MDCTGSPIGDGSAAAGFHSDCTHQQESCAHATQGPASPHEAEDEKVIYPALADTMEGDDPLASMSRSHREIFHLIDVYQRVVDDLPESGPEPADMADLRRLMYSLHAILRLHFDQEEELYASLDENYREPAAMPDGSATAR